MRVDRRRYNDKNEYVWAVTNGSSLTYKVDEHLSGFLRSVSNGGLEFIGSGGADFRAFGKNSISEGLIGSSPGNDAADELSSSTVFALIVAIHSGVDGVMHNGSARTRTFSE